MKRSAIWATAVLAASLLAAPHADAAPTCAPTTVQPRRVKTQVQPTKRLTAETYTFSLKTNCGTITIAADAKAAPITVRNLAAMAKSGYFNKSLCHRLSTDQIFILQCGDPTAAGTGGPGYSYADENLPTTIKKNRYPAGTVAMANSGANTNGSQFFIVYRDGTYDLPAKYTIWGHVTAGMPILKAIAAKGTTTGGADGWPAQAIAVLSVTVSEGTP